MEFQEVKLYIAERKVVFIIVIIALLLFAFWLTFICTRTCKSFACFQDAMEECNRNTRYLNDDVEASWMYKIKGKKAGECRVEVEIVRAKQGELGVEKLEGLSMICNYPLGVVTYPEKDLGRCSGPLKEELQTIVIDKLHSYIIENLGQLKEEINAI
jgi:hypothetical protein